MNTIEAVNAKVEKKVDRAWFIWAISLAGGILFFVNAQVSSNREDVIDLKSIVPVLNERTQTMGDDIKQIKLIIQR